ncbi:vomeronasal type-2 receptor 26-like, partial [Pelobates cultripes]
FGGIRRKEEKMILFKARLSLGCGRGYFLVRHDRSGSGRVMGCSTESACNLRIRESYEDYEYFQEGDIIIGGIFTLCLTYSQATSVHYVHIYANILTSILWNQIHGTPTPAGTDIDLHHYLKEITYVHGSYFDENGEFLFYFLVNYIIIKESQTRFFVVGNFTPWAPEDQQLITNFDTIIWKTPNKKVLVWTRTNDMELVRYHQCSENCPPGKRKVPGSSIHSCCYNCVPCSEGEISNIS